MRFSSTLGAVAVFVPAVLAAVAGADVRSPAASRPAPATPTPTVGGHPIPARTDLPQPTPTLKPATTPEPKPTSFATAPPRPTTTAVPVSLGAVPRAGTLEFSDGGRSWSYDGATGRIVEIARPAAPAKDGGIPADALAVLPRPGTADVAWIDAAKHLFYWDHKMLRTWSPERGLRHVTRPDEIALAPAWSANGKEILFVRGPSGDYVPLQHFSGTGVGARTLVAIDPATGERRTLPVAPGQVQEGVLPSRDGSARLKIRRGTVAPTWKPGDPDPAIEIWYADGAGAAPRVRLTTIGFGYYGAYPALSSFSWSR